MVESGKPEGIDLKNLNTIFVVGSLLPAKYHQCMHKLLPNVDIFIGMDNQKQEKSRRLKRLTHIKNKQDKTRLRRYACFRFRYFFESK